MNLRRLLLLACLLLAAVACRSRGDGRQRVAESGILRVGVDPTYPPFADLSESGELIGVDIDLARALAAELGVQAQFDLLSYDALYDALLTERVDVVISALAIDAQRTRDVAYSAPYFNAGQVLVGRAADPPADPAAVAGRRVAVELGSEGHLLLVGPQSRLAGATAVVADSAEAALQLLVDGAADLAIVDAVSARLFPHDALRIAPDPLTVEPFAMAVRRENGALLNWIDAALARLAARGELEALVQRRFARP